MNAAELRKLRKKLGWSQARLAREVGVAPNSVARWERGEMAISEPSARLIRRIADDPKVKTNG
jgi:transcriptional regulator with XRE-family HTH domain